MSGIYGPPCIIVYSWALLSYACPRLIVDQGDPEMYVSRFKKRWYTDSCVFRFLTNQDAVEMTVLEIVKENLSRRQAPDSITRNFLKLLTSAAGLVEVSDEGNLLTNFLGKAQDLVGNWGKYVLLTEHCIGGRILCIQIANGFL